MAGQEGEQSGNVCLDPQPLPQMGGEVDFSKRSMRTLWPVKPEQPNYSDCGIYLLHYVEKIFSSVAQFYWPDAVNRLNADWFPWDEVGWMNVALF